MLQRIRDRVASSIESLALTVGSRSYADNRRIPYSGRTLAGVFITPDNCVTLPVVWRALAYLSQTVAILPWHVMKDAASGAAIQNSHPIDWLIWKRPCREWSSFQFRETLVHWAVRWGNGYAEIEPDQIGRPFALWPIHPERVQVCRATEVGEDAYGEIINTGELYYEVQQDGGGMVTLSYRRMFHLRGFGEGPVGVNVVHYAAESLGWAKAVQMFGQSFFGNGANVAQVLINKKPIKPDGLRRQKAELDRLYKGPRNANKTAVFDNDAELKSVGLDAEKAQLNATNAALALDVCRWLGVPPHKVFDLSQAHFKNLETQNTEVANDSIAPLCKRLEDEADFKLFGAQNRQGFYTKIDLRGLMRGDAVARIQYYKGMWSMGAYSPNRILELEGENTLGKVGDVHLVQGQNVPLEHVGSVSSTQQRKSKQPAPGQDPSGEPSDPPAAALTGFTLKLGRARKLLERTSA